MEAIINRVLNSLIRNVNYGVRIGISVAFISLAILSFILCLRKKNDKKPIAWGWYILCLLSIFLAFIYVAL